MLLYAAIRIAALETPAASPIFICQSPSFVWVAVLVNCPSSSPVQRARNAYRPPGLAPDMSAQAPHFTWLAELMPGPHQYGLPSFRSSCDKWVCR